jgi:hypothetical protein
MSVRLRAALVCPLVVVLFGCTPAKAGPGSPGSSVPPTAGQESTDPGSTGPAPTGPAPASPSASDPGPSAPTSAVPGPSATEADPELWPYPQGCLETTVDWFDGYWQPGDTMAHIPGLRGTARPCADTATTPGVRLAVTQYQVVDGRLVGWMGSPWQTISTGSLGWSRTGELPWPFIVLCLSTGLEHRDGAVYAQHNLCVRPAYDPETEGWTEGVEVPVDDPSVTVALQRWPAPGDTAPAGCRNCFVTDPTAALPEPEPTSVGPVAAQCAELTLDTATLDEQRNIDLAGSVRSCLPGRTPELYLSSVRYTATVGDLGRRWEDIEEPDVQPFAKSGSLASDVEAICIINGLDESDDGLRGHHLLCLGVERNAEGALTLVPISLTDSRVTLPVDTLDDGSPISPCPSCL